MPFEASSSRAANRASASRATNRTVPTRPSLFRITISDEREPRTIKIHNTGPHLIDARRISQDIQHALYVSSEGCRDIVNTCNGW